MFRLDPDNCPASLTDNDVYCTCPFNFPVRDVNINYEYFVPDFAQTPLIFLASGDFDVTIVATMGTMNVLCVNLNFTIKL